MKNLRFKALPKKNQNLKDRNTDHTIHENDITYDQQEKDQGIHHQIPHQAHLNHEASHENHLIHRIEGQGHLMSTTSGPGPIDQITTNRPNEETVPTGGDPKEEPPQRNVGPTVRQNNTAASCHSDDANPIRRRRQERTTQRLTQPRNK